MTNTGGPSALRGYRLQTLYALKRILTAEENDYLFVLEGVEDLAIYNSEQQPVEFIQVKSYSRPLTLSDLQPHDTEKSERQEPPIFRRVLARKNTGAIQRLVQFGDIGPELAKAWSGHKASQEVIIRKLQEHAYSAHDSKDIMSQLSLDRASESEIELEIYSLIQKTSGGGEPEHAFEILSYWLHRKSERRESLTRPDILQKIQSIGKYLAGRSSYHQEWFTSISPVEFEGGLKTDPEELREEFYQGVGARYEHIVANVDVLRLEKSQEIAQAFDQARLVVLHGASGQGKSTLAYRYLHDYVPSQLRFEVRKIQDLRQAQLISRALIDHVAAMDTSVVVYLDVQPRDLNWVDVAESLIRYRHFRVLVTIREEDWTRATSLAPPSMKEIELHFNQEEAQHIYAQLIEAKTPETILDFEDAWQRFQPAGPLLEFVYMVTQNVRLRQRIEQQLKTLREETEFSSSDTSFLHAVAVASAYGARLRLRDLVSTLKIEKPHRLLERLEREYLIRTSQDGRFVEGLHPIRSVFIEEILTDDVLSPWIDAARTSLICMVESDIEIFLLYSFLKRKGCISELSTIIEKRPPRTWTGYGGVLHAYLWLDVQRHVDANRTVIDKAIAKVGRGWLAAPRWDIVNLTSLNPSLSESGIEKLDSAPQEYKIFVQEIRQERLGHAAFCSAKQWLRDISSDIDDPDSSLDWSSFAECAFWTGFWKLPVKADYWIKYIADHAEALDALEIRVACDVMYGLSFLRVEQIQKGLSALRPRMMRAYAEQFNIISIEDDGKNAMAHFFVFDEEIFSKASKEEHDLHGTTGQPLGCV